MNDIDRKEIISVLKALTDDWAIVDESDSDDFVIFVNESRGELENLKPKKNLSKSWKISDLSEIKTKNLVL